MNRKDAKDTKKKSGKKQINSSPSPTPPLPHSDTPTPDGWLEIGKIVAPQGLSGEVRVYPQSDFPERFEVPGKRWLLRPGEAEPQPIELVRGRYIDGKNLYVLKLAGVDNCDSAEELRGCKLLVHQSDRPELGEDEYHVVDLIGLPVFMQESGELVGTVVDIIAAGNDLLDVELHQQEEGETRGQGETSIQNLKSKIQNPKSVLIPFVKAIAPVVDLENRRIEITPPPGLLEVND
ncbi:16S rRNA processing protein RimM [Tolypothrix sp. NIES-4075]|uniref:ribosome maturation factor RimM n=1 Tax=Tolypothrix sp. NIES-4075 TaxID=2005459 RepID=UPI000B5CB5D8|nr:ribosome maturation factor RimM [Tolypothrix sp. NIES-4075]GAX44439.1 16S rRNA processing protein RimM [Tolypothrix sp. NIES-4075]